MGQCKIFKIPESYKCDGVQLVCWGESYQSNPLNASSNFSICRKCLRCRSEKITTVELCQQYLLQYTFDKLKKPRLGTEGFSLVS